MKWLMIAFIKAWRAVISPSYGNVCKYYPTCSEYGLEAVQHHGAIKGGALAMWRIIRCNPWSKGGYDPVPGTKAYYLWELEKSGDLPVGFFSPVHHEDSDVQPDEVKV